MICYSEEKTTTTAVDENILCNNTTLILIFNVNFRKETVIFAVRFLKSS